MNLYPERFEKKDHIFMDFFSMYGKNFIESKREDTKPNHKKLTAQFAIAKS
jgi:hypothetical protein